MTSTVVNTPEETPKTKKWTVSYTQYSTYDACPYRYKLKYIDKLGEYKSSIHTLFGVSFHEVLQEYITVMYNDTQAKADALPLEDNLLKYMSSNLIKITEKEGKKPCTKDEFTEFYHDGLEILKWFRKRKNRLKYYTNRGWELVGIELPLEVDLDRNVKYKAYLDVVLRDKNKKRVKIIDLKTSTKGWGKWAKADQTKRNQVLLYKKYFADVHGISEDKVDVEFHIIKRKLWEDAEFQQHHFQRFVPAQGKVSINRATRAFDTFVNQVFNEDGSFNVDREYKKTPGDECRNCKFCEFTHICDQIPD